MKTKFSSIAFAMLSLVIATQARAQTGIVGWVGVAGACAVSSGSAPYRISFGTVTFAPNASGTIFLACPIDGIGRIDPTSVNAFGLIFKNDNGFVGGVDNCLVVSSFIGRSNSTGVFTVMGAFSSAGHAYSGFTTADPLALNAFLNFDQNIYVVNVALQRAAGATCNPVVWATFAEEIIQ